MNFNQITLQMKYAATIREMPEVAAILVNYKRQTMQARTDSKREVRGLLYQLDGTTIPNGDATWYDDNILGLPWEEHQAETDRKAQAHLTAVEDAIRYNEAVRGAAAILSNHGIPVYVEEPASYRRGDPTTKLKWEIASVENERGYHAIDTDALVAFHALLAGVL